MLDQNTDRMWYVIGAVLIGAAIIFGMNTLMPNAFASVGDMFGDMTEGISYTYFWQPRFEYAGLTENRTSQSYNRNKDGVAGNYDYAPLFKDGAYEDPESFVYIHNVFDEPDVDYEFSFIGDRYNYAYTDYAFYFGDELVDVITLGEKEISDIRISGKSPVDLDNQNYIKFRSLRHTRNNFWMSQLNIERLGD